MLTWAFIASEWVIRIVMTPIVAHRKRRYAVALGWLIIIFLVPWVGLFAYVLLGENRIGRKRVERHRAAMERADARPRLLALEPHVVRPAVAPAQADLVKVGERLGGLPIVGGNTVEMMTESGQVVARIVRDIDAATDHVHLLVYIFGDDETGRRVSDALIRASGRGVKCRVIGDAVGARPMLRGLADEMRAAGVEVCAALPVRPLRRAFARIDLRNHRKLLVIDGSVAYTGSQNVVNPDYGHSRAGVWLDLMIRIVGPCVHQLQVVFLKDWLAEQGQMLDEDGLFPPPDTAGRVPVQVVPSGPTYPTEVFRRLTVAAINEAEKRLIITTPYLIPDDVTMVALELAVLRGVKVDIIVPRKGDRLIVGAVGRAHYDDLLEAGVNLHLHGPGLLHAKTMSVDDSFGIVSSGNFDMRSFFLNFELSLILYGESVTRALRQRQEEYLACSNPVNRSSWRERSVAHKALDAAARVCSPLL